MEHRFLSVKTLIHPIRIGRVPCDENEPAGLTDGEPYLHFPSFRFVYDRASDNI